MNAATGIVSNIVFNGKSYDSSSVGDILVGGNGTNEPTYVGFGVAGAYSTGPAFADNLLLTEAPEPSSTALMLAGLAVAGFALRRRLGSN